MHINDLGYVKGINNNITNSCGLTFESLLGKKADSSFLPDFEDIEIKTTLRFSRYSISLFSLSFDGPDNNESNYLLQTYGKKNPEYNNHKELIVSLKLNEKKLVNKKYYFELRIDYSTQRLFINIYDLHLHLIESRGFMSFDRLEERINNKLKKLALIFASKKIINDNYYFRYYQIVCYQFKDFKTFLSLIETNDVEVTLMLRFSKNEDDIGKNKNKNLVFSIKKKSISKLYNEIFSYDD